MATFLGQPVRPICLPVVSLYVATQTRRQNSTISNREFLKTINALSLGMSLHIMESVINFVHQCISTDERNLTGGFF